MRYVFVGAVREGEVVFREALAAGFLPDALMTLTEEKGAALSGWADWERVSRDFEMPLHRVSSINSPESEAVLRYLQPDILFVIGWTEIVKPHILAIPTRGCIGMHASLLPKYRGSAPVNWCLINGERETGNTMFWFSTGMDTGDIIGQRKIPISYYDTCATLYAKVAGAGARMLLGNLPALLADSAPRIPQTVILPAMPRRRPADGLIDWGKSPRAQYDWVRALTHPYPGAFSFLNGCEQVWIWSATPMRMAAESFSPGEIIGIRDRRLMIRTGEGVIGAYRLQVMGERERSARQFAARYLRDGVRHIFRSREEKQ